MTMTIEELMQTIFDNPLPEIDGYIHVLWDLDEPEYLDVLLNDEKAELTKEKTLLLGTIKKLISEIINKLPSKTNESDEDSAESIKSVHDNILTPHEILEKIKCRCRQLKEIHNNKKSIKHIEDREMMISMTKIIKHTHHKHMQNVQQPLSKSMGDFNANASVETDANTKADANADANADVNVNADADANADANADADAYTDFDGDADSENKRLEKKNCKQFFNVKDFATLFIDELLTEAEKKTNASLPGKKLLESRYGEEDFGEYSISEVDSINYSGLCSSVHNKTFTPKDGRELILKSIGTWNLRKPWNYCINFIAENSDTCADYYKYEIIWSLPTENYPIPQSTASVYYTITVSRVKGDNCPVSVTYKFETDRYTFSFEDDIQHEKFLDNIVNIKAKFFKALRI